MGPAGAPRRYLGERLTLPMTVELPQGARNWSPTPRHRLTNALTRLPSRLRRTTAVVLLLATAEMIVIARYGDGHPGQTPIRDLALLAPVIAVAAAVVLKLFGRLSHHTARLLGGTGHRRTTAEVLVLMAATIALPGGAATLVFGVEGDATLAVDMVLSVAALVVGVRLVTYLESVGPIRAAIALLAPAGLIIVLLIVLTVLQATAVNLLPAR